MASSSKALKIDDGLLEVDDDDLETIGLISGRSKQDESERREIREEYRNFMEGLTEHKEDLIDPTDGDDNLSKNLNIVNEMFRKVQMTREGALDSASLVRIADLGKLKAQALKTDFITFNPSDFCEKVRLKIAGDTDVADQAGLSSENWASLGHAAMPFFSRTPTLTFMCGAFDRGEVVAKPSKPKEKDTVKDVEGKTTKPELLSKFDETDRGERTTAQVEHLLRTLWNKYESQGEEPLCFFEFVTNPQSYGQTVENIFYTSFLVRDGHVRIDLDDDNLPYIEPVKRADKEQNQNDSVQRQQVVLTLSYKDWQDIVKTFEIEEAIIKPVETLKTDDKDQAGQGHGKGQGKKSVLSAQNTEMAR